jgi:hypothetical protein
MSSMWGMLAQVSGVGSGDTPGWVWTWWVIAVMLVIVGTGAGGLMFGTWKPRLHLRRRRRAR